MGESDVAADRPHGVVTFFAMAGLLQVWKRPPVHYAWPGADRDVYHHWAVDVLKTDY